MVSGVVAWVVVAWVLRVQPWVSLSAWVFSLLGVPEALVGAALRLPVPP